MRDFMQLVSRHNELIFQKSLTVLNNLLTIVKFCLRLHNFQKHVLPSSWACVICCRILMLWQLSIQGQVCWSVGLFNTTFKKVPKMIFAPVDCQLIQLGVQSLAEQCHTQIFSVAEQCHTQNFYLRCFKSDFDAVKSKLGLLIA